MALELPHKKVLVLASVCASVILIVFSFQLAKERKSKVGTAGNSGQIVAGESIESRIADKRILAALQDAQIASLKATSSNPFAPLPTDTVSDRFSKDVFSAFLKYNSDENTDLSAVSQDAVNNIDTKDLPKYRYNLSNIRLFIAKDTNEIKNYGEKFAIEYIGGLMPVNAEPEKYQSLKNLALVYKNVADRLLSVQVPDKVANLHLELTNSFQLLSELLPIIEDQTKDPLKSLLALSMVQEAMSKQVTLFTDIRNFFNQNGIIYGDQEMGRVWNMDIGSSSPMQ
ncbi:MAG TPA: hypothetical protein VGE62_00770 [Candidatus Paceibacterota bacterium]